MIRTHASPFWRSRPRPALALTATAGVAVAGVLPYTPVAAPLGFTALPPAYLLIVAMLVIVYLGLVEFIKRLVFAPTDLLARTAPRRPAVRPRRVHRRAARFSAHRLPP